MKTRCGLFVLAFAVSLIHGVVHGRTWRVEKDDSGDFTAIQSALNITDPGDTVLIGQGRFVETHEVVTPGWTNDVYAAVWSDSITILGVGTDVTIMFR